LITISVTDRDGQKREIQGTEGDRLMEVLRDFDWGVAAICGGMCSCATCHVYVDENWITRFSKKDSDEEDLLEFLDYSQENSRLSCQLELKDHHDGICVTLAPEE
jgi:2Fe-2S ferredoxin